MHLREELEGRWLLYQFSDEKVFDLYEKGGQAFYFGVDPTADSLHLGNFIVFMQAINYMKKGNKLYLIVWGATWMIGDPGGKDSERSFLTQEALTNNVESITKQVGGILSHLREMTGFDFQFEVINNMDFYKEMSFIDFLRDVGKHITVNSMIKKETVRRRIEEADKSISYTEFSYMLLQANDYVQLYKKNNVRLQICGSDQRGNCVTGLELIRKLHNDGPEAFVASWPLVLDSNGKKFGKSEWNAIWLDPRKSTPYSVYQYFINTTDEDVERYLKLLTLLDFDTIDEIVKTHMSDTSKRYWQSQLAQYVISTIFGSQAANEAQKISTILFSNKEEKMSQLAWMSQEELAALYNEVGGIHNVDKLTNILDLCVMSGLTSSKWDAKQSIQQWAIFMNEVAITDMHYEVVAEDYVNGVLLIRKGKKSFRLIRSS